MGRESEERDELEEKIVFRAPSDSRPEKKAAFLQDLKEWLISIGGAIAATLFITMVLIVNARVPTVSMEPLIHPGDRVIGLRMSYWFSAPLRGDIVIFRYPDDESLLFVKRVIGLPGDKVEIRDGLIYLNGAEQPLEEDYLKEKPAVISGSYTVPAEHYFVLGDNRNNSLDSRFWKNTYVARSQVIGKAVLRLFPNPQLLR